MKKLLILLSFSIFTSTFFAQTESVGSTYEYGLATADCNDGHFYLGYFSLGKYNLSANISGYDANNCGWNITVGRNYGSEIYFEQLANNIGGQFYALKAGSGNPIIIERSIKYGGHM